VDTSPIRFLRNLGRSREIATVMLNHGFGDLVDRLGLLRYLRWGKRIFLWRRTEQEVYFTRPQRIRLALEALGPTFIKFGQIMSTRPDLVPADVIAELRKLQESVPPFPVDVAIAQLERELKAPLGQLFAEFQREPIAAGSLAQVHIARHWDGTKLAVKIRRPNVVREVERDLSLMRELAILIERHVPESESFDPVGLVNQFARSIRRELNFAREGRTQDEFARLFRNDATLYVPRVYWDLTSEAVLTMEFIDGLRISDREEFKKRCIPPSRVAANGARIFLKQAFEFGVFHGDPHPGNLRVMYDGTICLLDFGMIGAIEERRREQLIEMLLAVTRQDVDRLTEVVLKIGTPYREIDWPLLRTDVNDFVQTYYGVPLERIDMGQMLTDFVGILTNHGIRGPAELMLLIRAMITLEGVGRDLDPEFNLAEHLVPFVERVIREQRNPRRIMNRCWDDAQRMFEALHEIPLHIERTLAKLKDDDLKIQLEYRGLDHLINDLDRSGNRLVVGMVMSSLILASALLARVGTYSLWINIPFFLLSSLLGIWLIIGIFRSGRL